MKIKICAAVAACVALASCGGKPTASDPSTREDASTAYSSTPQSSSLPPELAAAAKRMDDRLDVMNEAARKAKASDPQWAGVGSHEGFLKPGDDMSGPERFALAKACEDAAHAGIDASRIRVEKAIPDARVTCMSTNGKPITVRFDEEGDAHLLR